MKKIDYLKLISKRYPNIDLVSKEIINLSAIINLPKGTEHFLTDLHGEYESFSHVLRNASGVIRRKIDETFENRINETEKNELATLVYYPKNKLIYLHKKNEITNEWYFDAIYRLILLLRTASFKYTRSKVRKALPENFIYIIEELMQEQEDMESKKRYYNEIINTIIETKRADKFIIEISKSIRRLVIDKLHIVGDIYDRGDGSHKIMDELIKHHNCDIQWGNHDILWMGAAAGSGACVFNVLRIALRYANLETIQDGYGINLLPLAQFSDEIYSENKTDNENSIYKPKLQKNHMLRDRDLLLISKMQKAVAVIQFKLEGKIIKNNPAYEMEDRLFLDKLAVDNKTVKVEGKIYNMKDSFFPTLIKSNPYKLTEEEEELVKILISSFKHSEKLKEHIKFLYSKGSMYNKTNGNLLYHAAIPVDVKGEFIKAEFDGKIYFGKSLMDYFDLKAREAYFIENANNDILWYLWCGKNSPLFGKDKMKTFERLFIGDESLMRENKNAYYNFRNDESFIDKILIEFGLDTEKGHIVNGHVPVKTAKGENPVKAKGKLLVIDGGFSKAYQKITGIAGYTLTYNSQNIALVSHKPFLSFTESIYNNYDMLPKEVYIKEEEKRVLVADTDDGKELKKSILILKELLQCYRKGYINEL